MHDPHVIALHYSVGSAPDISYQSPTPVSEHHPVGEFRLADGELTIRLTQHFASEVEARAAVEPVLKAWKIESDLTRTFGMIEFAFLRATLVDRAPSASREPGKVHLVAKARAVATARASVHVIANGYPPFPSRFEASATVDIAYERWIRYREGLEPLPSFGNFLRTLVEAEYGSRKEASRVLKVDMKVLNKLGELTTERGDHLSARKVKRTVAFTPLADTERAWIEALIPQLILRVGQVAVGATPGQIGLPDLPALPSNGAAPPRGKR